MAWRKKLLVICSLLAALLWLSRRVSYEECSNPDCHSRSGVTEITTIRSRHSHTWSSTLVSSNISITTSHGNKSRPLYRYAPPLSSHFQYLTDGEVNSVEKFVFFVGYGRSGHSIVASLMDAHPNVIIANEYYLFDKLRSSKIVQNKVGLFNELYRNSHESALSGWRAAKKTSKGYNLNINGSWQGQFEHLKVIGDKTGGATALAYNRSSQFFKKLLANLKVVAGVPLRTVHVVRNPYDLIATVALYQASGNPGYLKVNASITNKFRDINYLELALKIILTRASAVDKMVTDCQLEVLEIHLEDLIRNSTNVIHRICEYLEVPCAENYVRACQDKVYNRMSKSRNLVMWPKKIQSDIEEAIKRFSFFRRYSFEGE